MNYMYERGRSTIGEWKPLNRGRSRRRCNNRDGDPNGRPGRGFPGDLEYPDGHLGVTCANCSGTFSGLGGPSRVDQPPLRAVSTRPEVEVYTLRRKGDLEGVWRLRAKTRQDSGHAQPPSMHIKADRVSG